MRTAIREQCHSLTGMSTSRLLVEMFLKMSIQVILHQPIHFEEIAQRFT